MFNLPLIDSLIERFTPHALSVRDESRAWMCAITDRLDLIADSVSGDDDATYHRHYLRPLIPGGAAVVVQDIPPGQEWHLEYWSFVGDSALTLRLFDRQGSDSANGDVPAATLVNGVPAGNLYGQSAGNVGLTFQGGQSIVLQCGGGTNARVFMQWRVKLPRTRTHNVSAGFRELTPDRPGAAQELETERRHVGSWGLTVNGGGVNHGASS